MRWFRLKACPKCRGDLVLDEGDWLCLQCGTYYYTGLYLNTATNHWDYRDQQLRGGHTVKTIALSKPGSLDARLSHLAVIRESHDRALTAPNLLQMTGYLRP